MEFSAVYWILYYRIEYFYLYIFIFLKQYVRYVITQKNIEARVLFIDFEFDTTEEGSWRWATVAPLSLKCQRAEDACWDRGYFSL